MTFRIDQHLYSQYKTTIVVSYEGDCSVTMLMLLKVTQCITSDSQWLFFEYKTLFGCHVTQLYCHVVVWQRVFQKYWIKPRGEWTPFSYLLMYSDFGLKVLIHVLGPIYMVSRIQVTLAELTFHLFHEDHKPALGCDRTRVVDLSRLCR